MGRITVFTAQDINSKQLLKALENRKLPYTEISLVDHPSRINDLKALEHGPVVPQVYFNNRSVGGLEKSLKELKRWDRSSRFNSPLEKYESEIGSLEDPEDHRLSVGSTGYKVVDPPPAPIQPHTVVKLPSGKTGPIREATELMKDAIPPHEEFKYKHVVYKHCFTGQALVEALKERLELSENLAIRFIQRLIKAGILHHVDVKHFPDEEADFQNTAKDYYRLQCQETPDIINSYRLWPKNKRDCVTVVEDLLKRLNSLEMESLDAEGLLDFNLAYENPSWSVFEDAVCELQQFSLDDIAALDAASMTAFSINVYWVMLRYAFLKSGIPLNEEDRKHFFDHVKFYMAGDTFSLHDWIDVLRGKPKQKKLKGVNKDVRVLMAIHMGAHNGSSWSSPFSRFSAEHLNEELECAAGVFCHEDRNVSVKTKDGKIKLTSIFKKYRSDFCTGDKNLLTVIQGFSDEKKKAELEPFVSGKEKIQIAYVEPELGFHASGPWYNQKGVQKLHDKKEEKRRFKPKEKSDPLGGGSAHSLSSSNHSAYSWL